MSTVVIFASPRNWPPWALMWALSGSIYVGCKWLTWRRACRQWTPDPRLSAGYLFGWVGMDADTFLGGARSAEAPSFHEGNGSADAIWAVSVRDEQALAIAITTMASNRYSGLIRSAIDQRSTPLTSCGARHRR